jgi:catechol 2,3-dioxygenase-like lactoylglutathione lyase family enzyme
MPTISRLLETALHVDDVDRSTHFYQQTFGLTPFGGATTEAGVRFFQPLEIPGGQVLLLFLRGSCTKTAVHPGGTIPPHNSEGQIHLAFAISTDELAAWRDRLATLEIPIEGEMTWPRGGTSLYFRDPDGHLLELATPGIWPVF